MLGRFTPVGKWKANFRAIDTDGTSLYFDLQGRMLNGKPVKGLYIMNGKKVISN